MIPDKHIDSAVISRRSGDSYDAMYRMHRYWSRKSPDVVADYIKSYTNEGDVVLDCFCGGGVVVSEACRLRRRVVGIDINPMATFITRCMLEPVALYQLLSAFESVKESCANLIRELYSTTCVRCGKAAIIDFVVWKNDLPRRLGYTCECSKLRLFRDITRQDKSFLDAVEKRRIPFWIPEGVPLPRIQKERYGYVHELFTKRNLICLSAILHAINEQAAGKSRDLLQLAFTSALDKCSKLKMIPKSALDKNKKPSLSMSWAAPRFYAPAITQEVNPWNAFSLAFDRVYEGKKKSNTMPPIAIGDNVESLLSGRFDAVILTGSADFVFSTAIPARSIDYLLTDPPYGSHIQYGALSTFWASWLRQTIDSENEIVVPRGPSSGQDRYFQGMQKILTAANRVLKPNGNHHFFYHDIRGTYFPRFVQMLSQVGFTPERVVYQPAAKSFGYAARKRLGPDEIGASSGGLRHSNTSHRETCKA